jgi:hypothetical protein
MYSNKTMKNKAEKCVCTRKSFYNNLIVLVDLISSNGKCRFTLSSIIFKKLQI